MNSLIRSVSLTYLKLFFNRRLQWLQLPAVVLIALLQRTPVLRLLVNAEMMMKAPTANYILCSIFTAASLGAVNSVAGATTVSVTPSNPVNGTVGIFLSMSVTMTGSAEYGAAETWNVTAANLPPGVSISGLSGGVVTGATLSASGTPTTAGSYSFAVQARAGGYNYGKKTTISFTIVGGTPPSTAAPTFSPAAGTFTSAQNVTISTSTSGASIRYTLDGSTPSSTSGTVYSSAVAISSTSTLKAIAYKSGNSDSSVTSGLYTISSPTQVAAPTFSPAAGTYTSAQNVTISTSTSGATIRYTLDGSTPTSTTGTVYSSAVAISSTSTLKAIAYKSGSTNSAVTSAIYTINVPTQVAAPTFSPAAGTFTAAQNVTISTSTSGASIRYTTDGSTPTSTTGNVYISGVAISSTSTLKAIAYKSGSPDSTVTSGTYTINLSQNQVAAPTVSPAGGKYSSAQSVTLTTSTSGASIRYTLNGSAPTSTSGTLYAGPVAINSTSTLQAVAYKSGMADSTVISVVYTIGNPTSAVFAWSNVGLHFMDDDYSVFALLPPSNTIGAQVMSSDVLVDNTTGVTLSYEAVADPAGSINTTSIGKTNFWDYASALFGSSAPGSDTGLSGLKMPGSANTPQPFPWSTDTIPNWLGFEAKGIPITPIDDAGRHNPYPLMRVKAKNSAGTLLGQVDVVLPVNDQMDCRSCHASNKLAAAKPNAGWINNSNPKLDFRLNILRKHDDSNNSPKFQTALTKAGYLPTGLLATAQSGKPILCAKCHESGALAGSGNGSSPSLTRAMHATHAKVVSPSSGLALNNTSNASACYECHSGSQLRGAMGMAINASNGRFAMQCQSCHGTIDQVAVSSRAGWVDEPNCQACHTGTARKNSGQIRYTNAVLLDGTLRTPADNKFATNADVPTTGKSLFRYSAGHFGMACSACHGSAHAEFPSGQGNDNIYSQQIQGHGGVIAECTACHTSTPVTESHGPHGIHPIGESWNWAHRTADLTNCKDCHGIDSHGTVLSRALADRSFQNGTFKFWKGQTIGCYDCHGGGSDAPSVPATTSLSGSNTTTSLTTKITVTPIAGPTLQIATLRIVKQPVYGSVGVNGHDITYYVEPGYVGQDTFTYAASFGNRESNLGVATVTITGQLAAPAFSLSGGTYTAPQYVTITSNSADATIRYTLDGSTPTATTGTVYNSAVTIRSTTTLKAVAYKTSGSSTVTSSVTSATYTINSQTQVAAPTFSPAAGTFMAAQNVTISTSTSGASIRYTTDGNTPTSTTGTVYSGAVAISSTKTLKAIAYKSGSTNSAVTSATYTINVPTQVAAPTFSPAAGTFTAAQNVTISTSTSGASIRYTTDGRTPTSRIGTVYSGPVAISSTNTLKAIAYKSGSTNSAVTSGTYTITNSTTTTDWEAENLTRTTSGPSVSTYSNDSAASAGITIVLNATATNNWIEFTLPNVPSGTYSLRFRYKSGTNCGNATFRIDGSKVGRTLDQYQSSGSYRTATIGNVTLAKGGNHTLRLVAGGKNASSSGYKISADRITLTKISNAGDDEEEDDD